MGGRTIFVDELKDRLDDIDFDITVNSAYISLIVGGIVSELFLSAIVVAVSVVNANERIAGKRRADIFQRSVPCRHRTHCPYGKVHAGQCLSARNDYRRIGGGILGFYLASVC